MPVRWDFTTLINWFGTGFGMRSLIDWSCLSMYWHGSFQSIWILIMDFILILIFLIFIVIVDIVLDCFNEDF